MIAQVFASTGTGPLPPPTDEHGASGQARCQGLSPKDVYRGDHPPIETISRLPRELVVVLFRPVTLLIRRVGVHHFPLAQLDPARGGVQRVLDAAMVVCGGLLIAYAIPASGSAVVWLTFAFGLGTAALTGLTLHEVANGR